MNSPSNEIASSAKPHPGQFSIKDVLIVTTLISIVLAILPWSPWLASALYAVLAGALVRTAIVRALRPRLRQITSSWSFWMEFVASIAIVVAAALAGIVILFLGFPIAFFFGEVSRPIPSPDPALLLISFLLSVAMMVVIFWATRNVAQFD